MNLQDALELGAVVVVVLAAVQDLQSRTIPNLLLLLGLIMALGLRLSAPQPLGALAEGLGGAAAGLCLFLPIYLLRGMAAGDVKLLATVGAFCGPGQVCEIALATCCIGGLMAIVLIIFHGCAKAAWRNVMFLLLRLGGIPLVREQQASVGGMPYGLAIALGTLFLLFVKSWPAAAA